MTIAYGYLRTSTNDQPNSPHVQSTAIAQYAASHSMHVQASFLDRLSGATPVSQRPALQALLQCLPSRSKAPQVILIAKRDRLARDTLIALSFEASLPSHTQIHSADSSNAQDPNALFLRSILDAVASHERLLIKQRTKQALLSRKHRSLVYGTVPFGFQREGVNLIPDPQEQATIQRALTLRARMSYAAIAAQLTQEGYRSRAGTPFRQTQVIRMLATHAS